MYISQSCWRQHRPIIVLFALVSILRTTCSGQNTNSERVIYFGAGSTTKGQVNSDENLADRMFQEFATYVGTVWIDGKHVVPTNADALSRFDVESLLPEYKAYLAAGNRVDLDKGQTLEQTWLTNQLFLKEPEACLINSDQPAQASTRITRKTMLTGEQMIHALQRLLAVGKAKAHQDLQTLIYDGKKGHVVSLVGIEKAKSDFIYWDPWPRSSFLARGNNAAEVAAQPAPNEERLWTVTPTELSKVVYACIVSVDQWKQIGPVGLNK